MKKSLLFIVLFCLAYTAYAAISQTRLHIQYDQKNPRIEMMVRAGVIESDSPGTGWILPADLENLQKITQVKVLSEETRNVTPLTISQFGDSLGQVIAIYQLPPAVHSAIGLGYQDGYFYLSDFTINNEVIYKLDPNDNFNVVSTFPAPGTGTKNPWGVDSDGRKLYVADGIQDRIFKMDGNGVSLGNIPAQGPLAAGLGYRQGQLWNSDLGQYSPPIPVAMYRSDTSGASLGSFTLSASTNGVAANDTAVFIARNSANGKIVMIMDPQAFYPKKTFPSPLDYPNGLALDGRYLWISGRDQNLNYMVQIDIGYTEPTVTVNFEDFDFIADGMFNNRFSADFDGDGNVHIAWATQLGTASNTKNIMYASNKTGIWEMIPITLDGAINEFPVLHVDENDVVHIMWKAFAQAENDNEIFYTNNGDTSGSFLPPIQITSKFIDGIDGHGKPDFAVAANGDVHFTFMSIPSVGMPEIYYAVYSQGSTTMPVDISNNSAYNTDSKIRLDAQENAHIFWNDYSAGLMYATNAGGSWQPEFVTEMGSDRPGAAIDNEGVVHFVVTHNDSVKYGNNASGTLAMERTVAVHAADCFYPDMAIDKADIVHITYHSFGDSTQTWPGNGEIFYSNNIFWNEGKFPQNVSQLPNDQELYPGIAATDTAKVVIGWARTGVTKDVFSDLRMATTLPDSGGFLAGKINLLKELHDFGYLPPLTEIKWPLKIWNTGVRDLQITNIFWDSQQNPPFVVTPGLQTPLTLAPGDSVLDSVTIFIDVPTRADTIDVSGYLRIDSDDPVEPQKSVLLQASTEIVGISDDDPAIVYRNDLLGNYPNPFNPATTISYSVEKASKVVLKIFNVRGQLVRVLINVNQAAGRYKASWDGRDRNGVSQPSGMYFYTLKIGNDFVKSRQMLLLK